MSKSLRYLSDGQNFSFDHAKVHSPSKQSYAEGGVTMPMRPMAPRPPAPAAKAAPAASNAIAGKAALGAYLLGEAKGAQEARQPSMRAESPSMARESALRDRVMQTGQEASRPMANGGYASGGPVRGTDPHLQAPARVTKPEPRGSLVAPVKAATQSVQGFAKGGKVRKHGPSMAAATSKHRGKKMPMPIAEPMPAPPHRGMRTPAPAAISGMGTDMKDNVPQLSRGGRMGCK